MKAWETFLKNVNGNNLVKPEDKALLAVSGGQDSMCMLHLFSRLAKKINIELLVVTFDHGLRKESAKESRLVKKFCEKLKIECISENISVKKYAREKSVSDETAGRNLRYENLEKIAVKHKCTKIATAHNANDNAETVLMWLLRGSGSFTGIPQRRLLSKRTEIIRPILNVKRKDIENYVKKQKIPFCTDMSNFSDKYTRNRIRKNIIPAFENINPSAIDHIFLLSRIQERENSYLEEISINSLKKCAIISKNAVLLDLTSFLRYNETIRFRMLKMLMPDKKYAFQINAVMDRILAKERCVYKISGGWNFIINGKNKAVFKRQNQNPKT
ncbi:MAG: tRNA lysidine(34) synthetase TilS [Endomicrobium sp.]|jgi:tRNA(Ile)-lysidine synthase|nr:tRNA lysidine(34) synthetase TilS [Endomicrobium sp.]